MEPTDSVTYGSCDLDLFPGGERSEIEARIVGWLETKSITMTDPLEKKDLYYLQSKKKIEQFRSLRSIQQISESMQTIKSTESIESLPSLKSIERKSLQLTGEGGSFLKESNTWKLKNRRRTGELESIPLDVNAVEN